MTVNANRKGKVCERAFANYLKKLGYKTARRGQQHAGGTDSPDVMCPELSGIHFEVKNSPRVRIGTKGMADALSQAARDAGKDKCPVVAWRQTSSPTWLLTYRTYLDMGFEDEVITVVADKRHLDYLNRI